MSSFASSISKVFYGTFIHSVSLKEIEYVPKGLLFVDTHGRIAKIIKNVPKDQFRGALDGVEESKVVLLNDDQFIIPGFVDSHIHAPQYAYCGNGHDIPLLDWLDTLTFPHEAKFKDASYARRIYTKAVARSLRNGTTSACWFATIHLDATKELVKVIEEQGQRAYVGKVNMNQNSPDFLTETTQSSVADTRAFIEYVNAINYAQGFDTKPLVTPIITPRFAISCTSDLLTELGKLAAEFDIPIQSHLCETLNEIEFTKSLFPNSTDYTSVYADHGLLTHRSIMAHCVHIKDEELQLMKDRGAGVSHCASSNFNIKSGLANVRKMVDMDLKVGLGTDVAGGFSSSVLDAFRTARTCSIARSPDDSLLVPELFYLATVGGARVMELEDTIGNFVVGKEFDAILVNVAAKHSPLDVFEHDTIRTKFEKYLFVGDDRNNEKVYVQGKEVRLPDV
ncbi:guanine deaminase [Linnemannia elongata]|nr:guanine deaminase [Linnemannia elongata]